jgi:hypothetical protein
MRQASLLAALILAAGTLSTAAAEPPVNAASTKAAATKDAAQSKPDARAEALQAARARTCVPPSASRIPRKPDECSSAAGRAYDHQDLKSTGAPTTAQALRLLDPTVH